MIDRNFDKKNKSDRFLLWKLQILRNSFKYGISSYNLKSWKIRNGKNGLSILEVIRNGFWTLTKTYGKLWHMVLKSKLEKKIRVTLFPFKLHSAELPLIWQFFFQICPNLKWTLVWLSWRLAIQWTSGWHITKGWRSPFSPVKWSSIACHRSRFPNSIFHPS